MPCDDVSIKVENMVKKFRLFGHPGDRIKQALTLGYVKYHETFTSLNSVSLEVSKGETVGIIGKNGSGKSTLLQIICGTLKPTSGKVNVNGKIAALLELGSGFNPEFTGRENVYFQGAVMGYSRTEIDERFSDIVEFADIGEFIDHPVRIYSSGMFVRLAFSAMIHTNADILVVDEALAVGDEAFQKKCYDKLSNYLENKNKILMLVSHNIRQIERICTKVVWLEKGHVKEIGEPSSVCGAYYSESISSDRQNVNSIKPQPNVFYSGEIDVNSIVLEDVSNDSVVTNVTSRSSVKIVFDIDCHKDFPVVEFEIGIHNSDILRISSSDTANLSELSSISAGTHKLECEIEDMMLLPGEYFVYLAIFGQYRRRVWVGRNLYSFRVIDASENRNKNLNTGIVDMSFKWKSIGS